MLFKVVERFVSINGEGRWAGQLAVFIRFAGCNLSCSYCDTMWANDEEVPYEAMSEQAIYQYIKDSKVVRVTLTGGEPLLQPHIAVLLEKLTEDPSLYVEVETNGSAVLDPFAKMKNPPSFTMDYKLPSSGMENKMCMDNLAGLTQKDTIKFVAGSFLDLERAKSVIEEFNLIGQTHIYISPVHGQIAMESIVEFMKTHQLNGVTLQVQLHKVIWDVRRRGV